MQCKVFTEHKMKNGMTKEACCSVLWFFIQVLQVVLYTITVITLVNNVIYRLTCQRTKVDS